MVCEGTVVVLQKRQVACRFAHSGTVAWFSMRSMARAIALVLVLLNKYEDLRVYGSCELPSSQYIYYWLIETIAFPLRER